MFNLIKMKSLRAGVVQQIPANPQASADAAAADVNAASSSTNKRKINTFTHPCYEEKEREWSLYRDAWEGGADFVEKYTQTYSLREDPTDFRVRKAASHCPAHAKASVVQIKNAIYQRLNEITRTGGPKTYKDACNGDAWGVDKLGSTMTTFIGKEVLPELLALGKVGVFVDHPQLDTNFTMLDKVNKRPYIYTYKVEDIRAWVPDDSSKPNQFKVLLLREHYLDVDPEFGLPVCWCVRYRFMKIIDTEEGPRVQVQFYDAKGDGIDINNKRGEVTYTLKLNMIPFVVFEITESLLTDIAMYQVGLLNLNSSDMAYALKMNFPFYIEQYDPISDAVPLKTNLRPATRQIKDTALINQNQQSVKNDNVSEEIIVGNVAGRRYPKGTDAPSFIHPSSDPLEASMKKEGQLKDEIHELLALWLSNVSAASSDVDKQDQKQGLEAGLSNIGMELEHGERRIAAIWCLYEGQTNDVAVKYPSTYSLKSDAERRQEAKELAERKSDIPSTTFQKTVSKFVVDALFKGKLPQDQLDKIHKEIDTAETMTCDVKAINMDLEMGLVSKDLASRARGYPAGEAAKGAEDRAKDLAMIQMAQSTDGALKNGGARGVPGKSPAPELDASLEKKDSTTDAAGNKKPGTQRGEGK